MVKAISKSIEGKGTSMKVYAIRDTIVVFVLLGWVLAFCYVVGSVVLDVLR